MDDSDANEEAKQRLTIGLYSPQLQGFFVGELLNQIRQLCFIKGYRLVVIRTGDFGRFDFDLNTAAFDAVIILRNAIANNFAESLILSGIPCVSIAFDYFPLKVPMISSDNDQGMRLAFEHLQHRGHSKIIYIGDLSQYDLRKRYESYCDLHEEYQQPLNENYLISVDDCLFSGGYCAAKHFLDAKLDANAVIFGAGLTGIGFLKYLKKHNPERMVDMDFVCFDALALVPVLTPELVSIDQNLHLIAYRALNSIEAQLEQKTPLQQTLVTPKITRAKQDGESYDAFIATCVDLPEFHNPNYMKSVVSNLHEWPREVVKSNLNDIMSLSPMFERFMESVHLSRIILDNNRTYWSKHTKSFTQEKMVEFDITNSHSLCRTKQFPPSSIDEETTKAWDLCLHIPIEAQEKIWSTITIYGCTKEITPASSFFGFTGYIESIADLYEKNLQIKLLKNQIQNNINAQSKQHPPTKINEAKITWLFNDNVTTWSNEALSLLQFTSAMDLNIYRNIDITDRMDNNNTETLRNAITDLKSNQAPFTLTVKFKQKNGQKIPASLHGEALPGNTETPIGICFYLTEISDSDT